MTRQSAPQSGEADGTFLPSVAARLGATRARLVALVAPSRVWDWWEFKVPTLLGVAGLTAGAATVPAESIGRALLTTVVALVPLASYVSVINDFNDVELDRRAGKFNSMAGRPASFRWCWVAGCVLAGGAAGALLARTSRPAFWLYVANWVAFTLYSAPPFRWKNRRWLGVLADGCGGQFLPTMWTAVATAALGTRQMSPLFLPLLAAWSAALGIRGIMAHQVRDAASDRAAGAGTLGASLGVAGLEKVGARAVFPVEATALVAFLVVASAMVPFGVLLAAVVGQTALATLAGRRLAVVNGTDGHRLMLFRYYVTLFPLSVLPTVPLEGSSIAALAALLVAVFPGSWGLSPARFLATLAARSRHTVSPT
jgi:1,4-dihydroxy-2-naphthoate octaprenyltransferase